MPVIRTSEQPMHAGHRPAWSRVTSAGIFRVPCEGGRFDCHYHDCNEYWLICTGKMKIAIDGKAYYVKDGDIVCTRAGQVHDVLEMYEPIVGYHFEDATPAGGRTGHLHKTDADAKGHSIPKLPLPADFPKD